MPQKYEQYWSVTLEYSNILGSRFNQCLRIILDFIDEHAHEAYTKNKYSELQKKIEYVLPKKDSASTRKSINQFVKLGFIQPKLNGYHNDARQYLKEKDRARKKALFSGIVYSHSSFNSSVTELSQSREINFLIKTLQKVHKLDRDELLGLMTVDTSLYPDGYTKVEVGNVKRFVEAIGFKNRKYNQLSHLWSVLKNLIGLRVQKHSLSLDVEAVTSGSSEAEVQRRDPYLHRIYKEQLKLESKNLFGKIACMSNGKEYASLIASHIKPFIESSTSEQYDPQNGLLLNRNLDILFDRGNISFGENGKILLSKKLTEEMREPLADITLPKGALSEKRLFYLKYHREHVFS